MEQSDNECQESKLNRYAQKPDDLDLIHGKQIEPWVVIGTLGGGREHPNRQNAKSDRGEHKMLGSKFRQTVYDQQVRREDNCDRCKRNQKPFTKVPLPG